jgi:hypothetical protein
MIVQKLMMMMMMMMVVVVVVVVVVKIGILENYRPRYKIYCCCSFTSKLGQATSSRCRNKTISFSIDSKVKEQKSRRIRKLGFSN